MDFSEVPIQTSCILQNSLMSKKNVETGSTATCLLKVLRNTVSYVFQLPPLCTSSLSSYFKTGLYPSLERAITTTLRIRNGLTLDAVSTKSLIHPLFPLDFSNPAQWLPKIPPFWLFLTFLNFCLLSFNKCWSGHKACIQREDIVKLFKVL